MAMHLKKRLVEDEEGSLIDPGMAGSRARHGGKRLVEDDDGDLVDPSAGMRARHGGKRLVEDDDGELVDPGMGVGRARHGGKRLVEDDDGDLIDPGMAAGAKRARYGGKRLVEEEDEDEDDGLVDDDDDDYEEEPAASMAVDDDDDEPEDFDSADEYDDELYKNAQDRAELLGKTDLEREMILADRHDRKQRRNETLQVRREMREQRAKAAKAKPASKVRDAGKSAASAKSAKLAELAAKRQSQTQKKERQKALAREESRRREYEEAAAAADRDAPAESAAPIDSIERIRLTRTRIESWLNEPFFEEATPGCFVRVGIGRQEGRAIYRVAQVTGVKDGFRLYTIEKKQTTKRLELKIGASKRYFEISFVSNSNFEMGELNKYQRILQEAKLTSPTISFIDDKVKHLKACKNKEYTHEEVKAIVAGERKANKMKGNLARDKTDLRNEILGMQEKRAQYAQCVAEFARTGREQEGKSVDPQKQSEPFTAEDVAEKEKELTALEGKARLEKDIEQKRESASFRIDDINVRNREFERQIAKKVGEKTRLDDIEISAGRVAMSDPFKRLPIKPVIYWDVSAGKKEEEAPPPPAKKEKDRTWRPGPNAKNPELNDWKPEPSSLVVSVAAAAGGASNPLASPGFQALLQTPKADDELGNPDGGEAEAEAGAEPKLTGKRADQHKIDIDIDIDTAAGADAPLPTRARPIAAAPRPAAAGAGAAGTAGGQRLSLSEYRKRAQLL